MFIKNRVFMVERKMKCTRGWFDKFTDSVNIADVTILFFICIILACAAISFVVLSDSSSKELSRATNVLERYATSYESLQSTDSFLMSQIDVVDVNDGKAVAISFYSDDRGKLTIYFHVNSDLSYRHVEKEQTVFFSSQGS